MQTQAYNQARIFKLKNSRFLSAFIVANHFVVLAALLLINLPMLVTVVVTLVVIINGCYCFFCYRITGDFSLGYYPKGVPERNEMADAVYFDTDWIHVRGGSRYELTLAGTQVLWSWVLVLRFCKKNHRRPFRVLVLYDAIDQDGYRSLSRIVSQALVRESSVS